MGAPVTTRLPVGLNPQWPFSTAQAPRVTRSTLQHPVDDPSTPKPMGSLPSAISLERSVRLLRTLLPPVSTLSRPGPHVQIWIGSGHGEIDIEQIIASILCVA